MERKWISCFLVGGDLVVSWLVSELIGWWLIGWWLIGWMVRGRRVGTEGDEGQGDRTVMGIMLFVVNMVALRV